MKYRKEIDGLRALAVIPVIFFHAGFKYFDGGFIGVDIFFVISGYLITSILIQDISKNNFSLINFYDRRIRRILPALFFVTLLSIPFAFILMMPTEMLSFSKSLISSILFLSNFFFWRERGYFGSAVEEKPLIHTWSLSIEEQYYLLFPILLYYFWRFGRTKLFWIIISISLISFFLSEWGSKNKPIANFYLTPTRAWEILVGSLTAIYLSNKKISSNDLLSFIGIFLIVFSIFFYDTKTPFPSHYTLLPIVGVVLLIIYANEKTLIAKFLGNKILVKIGLISYSLYLIHQPIFAYFRISPLYKPEMIFYFPLIFISILLAVFSWKYIEQPFRDKKRIKRNYVFKLSLVFALFIILIGLIGIKTNGFNKLRFSSSDREFLDVLLLKNYSYVIKRFEELKNKDWDTNRKTSDVLIIGDSYAKDLVNAIYEANLNENISLKVKEISAQCGNLFIEFEKKEKNIHPSNRLRCKKEDWANDLNLIEDLTNAEQVWLISSWREWHLEFISSSIKNLSNLTPAKVLFFGRKDFPDLEVKKYIGLNISERSKYKEKIDYRFVKLNQNLRRIVGDEKFIEIQKLACGVEKPNCKIFDDNGKLKTWDGAHFTKSGAKWFGKKLKSLDIFN